MDSRVKMLKLNIVIIIRNNHNLISLFNVVHLVLNPWSTITSDSYLKS